MTTKPLAETIKELEALRDWYILCNQPVPENAAEINQHVATFDAALRGLQVAQSAIGESGSTPRQKLRDAAFRHSMDATNELAALESENMKLREKCREEWDARIVAERERDEAAAREREACKSDIRRMVGYYNEADLALEAALVTINNRARSGEGRNGG